MGGAAVAWVIYALLTKPLGRKYGRVGITFWQSFFGLLGCIPFALAESSSSQSTSRPINIPKMLELAGNYDLVIGSRYVHDGGMVNWGVGRFFISRLANNLTKWILGLTPEDCSGGYKCYQADLLRKIDLKKIFSPGYSFQVEILYRAVRLKAKIKEFPIIFVNRHEGESKLSMKELALFAGTLFKLRWMAWTGKI